MARRKTATPGNRSHSARALPVAFTRLQQVYSGIPALLAAPDNADWRAVIRRVCELRSLREKSEQVERRIVALVVLGGAPLGEVAAELGVAGTTLARMVRGTSADGLGEAEEEHL